VFERNLSPEVGHLETILLCKSNPTFSSLFIYKIITIIKQGPVYYCIIATMALEYGVVGLREMS